MVVYRYDGEVRSRDSSRPLMTIAMIMYNRKKYVRPAVIGLMKQNYPNLEIVISDDCSEDGAGEAALEIVKNYRGPHRVVFNVNERNLGLGGNFGEALSLSEGEWVITCGGDDIQHFDRVSRTAEIIEKHPTAVVVGCGADIIDENGKVRGGFGVNSPCLYRRYSGGKVVFAAPNTADGKATLAVAAGACAAYRKDLCRVFPFPSGAVFEDLVMDLRAIQCGDIVFVPEKLVDYRVHGNNLCSGGRNSKKRRDRRRFRYGISLAAYRSWREVLLESIVLQRSDDSDFVSFVAFETAKFRVWSLPRRMRPDERAFYISAYKMARRKYSFLKLMQGAEGRGRLRHFLILSFFSLFSEVTSRDFLDFVRVGY